MTVTVIGRQISEASSSVLAESSIHNVLLAGVACMHILSCSMFAVDDGNGRVPS